MRAKKKMGHNRFLFSVALFLCGKKAANKIFFNWIESNWIESIVLFVSPLSVKFVLSIPLTISTINRRPKRPFQILRRGNVLYCVKFFTNHMNFFRVAAVVCMYAWANILLLHKTITILRTPSNDFLISHQKLLESTRL